MDTAKVDLLIQFALAVAAEEDALAERELGPIHLIKYVYLADSHTPSVTTGRHSPARPGSSSTSVPGTCRSTLESLRRRTLFTRRCET